MILYCLCRYINEKKKNGLLSMAKPDAVSSWGCSVMEWENNNKREEKSKKKGKEIA